MLCALAAMYCVTESWVGKSLVLVFFVNDLMCVIKEGCVYDGFFQCLHVLVLMDDTVLLATTGRGMLSKIYLLYQYCTEYGMVVN